MTHSDISRAQIQARDVEKDEACKLTFKLRTSHIQYVLCII